MLLAAALVAPSVARAQFTVRTWLPWRTIETQHFSFHYPRELEEWTQFLAARIESIDSAVTALVGYQPPRRTQVIVDDPYATANGSALPFLEGPVINLWAVTPDPRDDIATFRNWGEMLAAHEFTHIAHLTRPSRNSLTRLIASLLPIRVGPITEKAPRWVLEGYATYAEGRLTGSGRPNGAWRPAFLRQWAIEGQLPTYDQMSRWGAYAGGEFAYLAGSAFLEWLVERRGDSSLVQVWRRLTARQNRSFDEAFSGVFGQSPRTLYGRFTAELTSNALTVERALAGGDTGTIVQRLSWQTGDPSISPDGKRVALVVRSPVLPSRTIIWHTANEPDTTRARRDSILLARDPEDVPPRSIYPPPKKTLAALPSYGGHAYEDPRFLDDGRLLVWRNTTPGNGTLVPDLFLWDPEHHDVRRVTRNAGVRDGDPAPDGRSAVALQCRGGHCDVVRVDLETGDVSPLTRGSATRSYYRPRFASDGRRIVAAEHASSRWRLVLLDVAGSAPRAIDPDDGANRYDAEWLSPTTLVCVSERGGIPNLEEVNLATGAVRPLTRVTGAAVAPAPNRADSSIWFLSLYSRGYDVRRVRIPPPPSNNVVATVSDPRLAPAVQGVSRDAVAFTAEPLAVAHPYRLTPQTVRWFPAPEVGADGYSAVLAVTSSDVIGKLRLLAQVAAGDAATWRGASVEAAWRGFPERWSLQLFDAAQRPRASRAGVAPALLPDDVSMRGLTLSSELTDAREVHQVRVRQGASLSTLGDRGGGRALLFVEATGAWQQRSGLTRATESIGTSNALGRTRDSHTRRNVGTASFFVASGGLGLRASAAAGTLNSDADPFERFTIGGMASPLVDQSVLTQRVVMPILPTGVATSRTLSMQRVDLSVAGFAPYFWVANGHRVAGLDWTVSEPVIPQAATPGLRAQFGVGRSLDAPFVNKTRAYVSALFVP